MLRGVRDETLPPPALLSLHRPADNISASQSADSILSYLTFYAVKLLVQSLCVRQQEALVKSKNLVSTFFT